MWNFIASPFLYAGLAAVFPLLLHLLSRRKTVRIRFSTLRFLKLAQKQTARRIRMENILLWLLRTALILLLALAFARPYIRSHAGGIWQKGVRRDIAIVWDESYSMRYESSRKNVWDEARAAILSVLAGLNPGDRVCLYMAGDDVTPLIAKPVSDMELIQRQVKSRQPGTSTSQLLPGVLAAAQALHEAGTGEHELYVITDGQALPWAGFKAKQGAGAVSSYVVTNQTARAAAAKKDGLAWPPENWDPNLPVFLLLGGVTTPENAAPVEAEVAPVLLRPDLPAQVSVSIGATGPARDSSVVLYVDDKEISRQNVTLGGGASAAAVLALPPLPVGTHSARVETPRDGLALDDALYFLLRVREKLPVLCVGAPADLFFLERALKPGDKAGAMDTRTVAPAGLAQESLETYAAVFLCNALPLPGQGVLALEKYVRAGGLLVIFPGDRAQPADYANIACLPAQPTGIADYELRVQRRVLRLLQPRDPIFASLHLPPGAAPALAIQRALNWKPVGKGTETLLSAGDSLPFLVSRPFGRGRVLMLSVSADRAWSNLPLSPFFLPLLHQMVLAGAGQGEPPLYAATARDVDVSTFIPEAPEGASLIGPHQTPFPLRRIQKRGEISLHAENLTEPGIYSLARTGAYPLPALALNVPREESDLTMLGPEEARRLLNLPRLFVAQNKDELARQVEANRVGKPLGELLLWITFAVALLEWFASNRMSRKTAALTSRLHIDPSGRVHAHA